MNVGNDQYGAFHPGISYGSMDGSMNGSRHGSVRLSRNGNGSTKADEAFLLSQATTTAMIAARSILMSGGSEETALRTAKAAAQSVLNPKGADADCVSGKSNTFLRRRKAKRQAEVVASMALMSAASNVQSTANADWENISVSSASQNIYPPRKMVPHPHNMNNSFGYAQNITTRPQEDPSVLSGSNPSVLSGSIRTQHSGFTKERARSYSNQMLPPKSPRARVQKEQQSFEESKPSKSPRFKRVQKEQQSFESKPFKPSKQASPVSSQHSLSLKGAAPAFDPLPLAREGSERTGISKVIQRVQSRLTLKGTKGAAPAYDPLPLGSERTGISKVIQRVQSRRKEIQGILQDNDPLLIHGSRDSSKDQEDVVVRSNDSSSCSSSEQPERTDDESLGSLGTEDESVQPRSCEIVPRKTPRSSETKKDYFIKKHVDPVLFSFTNAFNAFNCGPMDLNAFMSQDGEEDDKRAKKEKRKSGGVNALKSVEHRDDVEAKNLTEENINFMSGDDDSNFQDAKQDDEEEHREVIDSFDQSENKSDFVSSSSNESFRSRSSASADSEQILSQLNMSVSEEGEIQVRSSIRETMENIVSKSHKKGKKYDVSNSHVDRNWLAYELRQTESPERLTSKSTVQSASVQTPTKKKDEEKGKKSWFRAKREAAMAKTTKKRETRLEGEIGSF
jgi:hypothetical protein